MPARVNDTVDQLGEVNEWGRLAQRRPDSRPRCLRRFHGVDAEECDVSRDEGVDGRRQLRAREQPTGRDGAVVFKATQYLVQGRPANASQWRRPTFLSPTRDQVDR